MRHDEYQRMRAVENSHWRYVAMRNLIADALTESSANTNGLVFDLGCGTGANLENFGGAHGIGLDQSREALQYTQDRGVMRLACGDASSLPFASGIADLIICADVLYHAAVPSPRRVLEEIARVLKPDGRVLIVVPAFEWLRGSHDDVVHGSRRFTPRQLAGMMRDAGLEPVRITCWLSLLLPLVWLMRKLPSRAEAKSDLDAAPGPLLSAILGTVMSIERALIRLTPLPLGTSIIAVASKR